MQVWNHNVSDLGYSGTPLPKKLGLKDGQHVAFVDLPESQNELAMAREFEGVQHLSLDELSTFDGTFDVLHIFTKARAALEDNAKAMLKAIKRDGMVWISWPKKASKVATDITEDVLREVLLPTGLVDIKVCAVDEIWSGLKFVIRKELR